MDFCTLTFQSWSSSRSRRPLAGAESVGRVASHYNHINSDIDYYIINFVIFQSSFYLINNFFCFYLRNDFEYKKNDWSVNRGMFQQNLKKNSLKIKIV